MATTPILNNLCGYELASVQNGVSRLLVGVLHKYKNMNVCFFTFLDVAPLVNMQLN